MAATCWLVTVTGIVGGTYETGSEEGEVTGSSANDRLGQKGDIRVTIVVGSDGSDDSVVKLFDQL